MFDRVLITPLLAAVIDFTQLQGLRTWPSLQLDWKRSWSCEELSEILQNSILSCICEQYFLEAVVRRCSVENVFLKISQNSHWDICVGVSLFFNKVVGLRSATLLKKRLRRRCSPVNFAKFLRTTFIQTTPRTTASVFLQRLCFVLWK